MTRVLSGAVLIALTVAVVWFAPPLVFEVTALALVLLASYELLQLARAGGLDVPRVVSLFAAGLTFAVAHEPTISVVPNQTWFLSLALVAAFLAVAFVVLSSWRGGPNAIAVTSVALLPSVYLSLPLALLVLIRRHSGPEGLFLLMLTVMLSDTAQYYTGRLFGRTPLAPAISPKKTMEGATGGFVFGALTFVVAGAWWLPAVPVGIRAAFGVAIVAMGIAGDLFESMLKRSAGVKDSSSIIPGHGGVLDRIDALLFAAPVYYVLLLYV